jgi:hypothetical protein
LAATTSSVQVASSKMAAMSSARSTAISWVDVTFLT